MPPKQGKLASVCLQRFSSIFETTIQYNTKFIYIVGDTNSITLAMNSYLPTYKLRQVYCKLPS